MNLEPKEKSMIFSSTEIPDVLFTEYFPQANGDFIKVYLYLVFLAKYNKNVRVNDLSKKLSLALSVIEDALSFWDKAGVITKKTDGFIINNMQEVEFHKIYKPNVTISPEKVEENSKNRYRARAIESINTRCFQGIMSPVWYSDIDLWFKQYGFDEPVMIALFDTCFQKSSLNRNYVQAVAEAWAQSNIKTYTDLEKHQQKYEKLTSMKKAISKKLGKYSLTEFEGALIEKWTVDYGYDMDIINIALKKTVSKANPTFEYLDSLITNWKDNDLKTVTDIENYLTAFKQKNKKVKELQKKTNYNNYEQTVYENLDELYANKKKRSLK